MNTRSCDQQGRIALLGASNLSLLFYGILDSLRIAEPRISHRVFVAKGPGRGYGLPGAFAFRRVEPLVSCGIEEALLAGIAQENPSAPPRAILMDTGNDLLYGATPGEIADWVSRIIDKLTEGGVRVTLMIPPAAAVLRMSPLRFRILKGVLFPLRKYTLKQAQLGIVDLCEKLSSLSSIYPITLERDLGKLMGMDGIHIAGRHYGTAASIIASHLAVSKEATAPPILPGSRIFRQSLRRRSAAMRRPYPGVAVETY